MAKYNFKAGARNYCTIITDASYCPVTGAAGAGFWVTSDSGREIGGQAHPETCDDPTHAEMWGMLVGLKAALQTNKIRAGAILLFQCDSTGAMRHLENEPSRTTYLDVYREFHSLLSQYNLQVQFKHVKGHSNSDYGSRYYCNNYCDTTAKRFMKQRRGQLQTGRLKNQIKEHKEKVKAEKEKDIFVIKINVPERNASEVLSVIKEVFHV